MNKFIATVFCSLLVLVSWAQKVTVVKSDQRVRNENATGYSTELNGKRDDVSLAWLKFVKELGKTRQTPDPQTITEPTLGGTVYATGILYAVALEKGESTVVWLGLKTGEWVVNDIEIVNRELDRLVYQFGVKYYKDKIQAQIDEAQRALDAVDRQKQRLTNQSRDFNIRLGNNEQEKIQLEKSIEANKLENAVLIQRLVDNKKSQDSVVVAAEQIKKVIELRKGEQQKVN